MKATEWACSKCGEVITTALPAEGVAHRCPKTQRTQALQPKGQPV